MLRALFQPVATLLGKSPDDIHMSLSVTCQKRGISDYKDSQNEKTLKLYAQEESKHVKNQEYIHCGKAMVWLFLQLLCREVFAWALQAGVSGQVGSNFGQAHRDKSYKDSHHNGHIGMLTTWNLHSEDPIVDRFHCTFSHVMKTSRR